MFCLLYASSRWFLRDARISVALSPCESMFPQPRRLRLEMHHHITIDHTFCLELDEAISSCTEPESDYHVAGC